MSVKQIVHINLGFSFDFLIFQIKNNVLADKLVGLPPLPSDFLKAS